MKVESQKYEQRRKERASKELWANTTELIEMNQKLKQKIRKQWYEAALNIVIKKCYDFCVFYVFLYFS